MTNQVKVPAVVAPIGVRRSILFVPAANERALEKARTLKSDAIIFDLEDSVASQSKASSRSNLLKAMQAGSYNAPELLVRINGVDSPEFSADIETAHAAGVNGVVLPKVETVRALTHTHALNIAAGREMQIWAMIETPLAILDIAAISGAASSLPLTALMVGPNDLVRTTGVSGDSDRQFLIPWLMQIVLAAKAREISVVDGVYNAFQDEIGFTRECNQAASMGFDGKALIHPGQIDRCNTAFGPTETEVSWAEKVDAAFSDSAAANVNVMSIDGAMVERLHLSIAHAILARARRS